MSPPPSAAIAIVGPFVVRSRKGNFGNQDLESALRMALAHRQDPDVEFIETGSGRRFNCTELIDALDRQDHCPMIDPPAGPSPTAAPGLTTFRDFATSTVDLDLAPPGPVLALPPPVAVVSKPARRSDRLSKRSDRKRSVGGSNAMLIGALVLGAVVLGVVAWVLLRGGEVMQESVAIAPAPD